MGKLLFSVLLLSVLFGSHFASGQVVFDENYKRTDKGPLPYGETTALTGKKSGLIKLLLTVYVANQRKDINLSVHPDGSWDGILEPLSAKTRVVFKFTELRKATSEDKETVRKAAASSFDTFRVKVSDFVFKGVTDAEYKGVLDSLFRTTLSESLANYQTEDKQPLTKSIDKNFQVFSKNNLDSLRALTNEIGQRDDASNGIESVWKNLSKGITRTDSALKANGKPLAINSWKTAIADSLLKTRAGINVLDSLRKYEISNPKSFTNLAKGRLPRYGNLKQAVEVNMKVVDDFLTTETNRIATVSTDQLFSSSVETESMLTADILKYASIDVSGLLFPNAENNTNRKAFGSFSFMITPYIQDFAALVSNRKNKPLVTPRSWGIDPCLGISLFQVLGENPKPVYFLGASVRLSDGFRANAGWSVFKTDKNDAYFQGMFGFGVSLHVAYLGDLLKIFSATLTSANGFLPTTTATTQTTTNP